VESPFVGPVLPVWALWVPLWQPEPAIEVVPVVVQPVFEIYSGTVTAFGTTKTVDSMIMLGDLKTLAG
jgi:hypothetical protein